MKPTLFVLAAGMGSRYGGLKQLDGVGPKGETIIDYSVFDAIRAGFGKIVFVIRHSFEEEFKEKIISKYSDTIQVELVFQELSDLPAGFRVNPDREKPWGTNHAMLMAKDVIKEPFAIINADDFYGAQSYQLMADFLTKEADGNRHYCMIGFNVANTLSDKGGVTRGVCEAKDGYLTKVIECSNIQRNADGTPGILGDNGEWQLLAENTPVSMNMWGFTPDYFELAEKSFIEFLNKNKDEKRAESLIPTVVDSFVKQGDVKVKVISTPSKWFGVTYADDKPIVVQKIRELIDAGEYPQKLFS